MSGVYFPAILDEDDLFQCGKCKKQFTSLPVFVAHKQTVCLAAQLCGGAPLSAIVSQPVTVFSGAATVLSAKQARTPPGSASKLMQPNWSCGDPISARIFAKIGENGSKFKIFV